MTESIAVPKKILVTGGHMTPALAVIAELRERGYNDFLWVGHKFNQTVVKVPSAEFNTVTTEFNIPFIDLKAGKLSRNWGGGEWLAGLVNLVKVPWGFVHATWIILLHRPDLILSFGGYIALPIAVMGKLLGRTVITHEQTAVTGLTNRIIPRFSDKVLISWPQSAEYYPAHKTVLVGNPLRPEIRRVQELSKYDNADIAKSADSFKNLDTNVPVVFVTGGNQGSHKLNAALFAILPDLLTRVVVIHQTGSYDNDLADTFEANLTVDQKRRYLHQPFFYSDSIAEVFALADLVICRSGANTVYELLSIGKPSILIPIPWVTHNEQFINASIMKDVGLGLILEERYLEPATLQQMVIASLKHITEGKVPDGSLKLAEAAERAQAQVIPDAATRIAEIVLTYLTK